MLLGRRPERKRHGGLWEFPGGKLKDGETMTEAVTRELSEELELETVTVGSVRFTAADAGSRFLIHFVDVDAVGEPRPVEHSEVGWHTAHELRTMPLAPADAAFVRSLSPSADPGSTD